MDPLGLSAPAARPTPEERSAARMIANPNWPRPHQMEAIDEDVEEERAPRRGQYRQLIVQPLFRAIQDVKQVRFSVTQLELGLFFYPAILWNTMMADDRTSAVVDTLVSGLFSLPTEVRPDESRTDEKAIQVAELAGKQWPIMVPQGEGASMLRWGMGLGVGLAEKMWTVEDGLWWPRLRVWDDQFAWWNMGTHTYYLNTDPTGNEEQMRDDGATIEIPESGDDHWAVFHPYRGSQGWWDALLRSIATPWLVRNWAIRDWARFSEIFGTPARVGYVPEWASASQRENFIAQLAGLGNEPVLELPVRPHGDSSFDFKIVQATANEGGVSGYKELLNYCDTCLAIRVLGQNLTTEVHGGSHAAAKIHDNVRRDVTARWVNALEQCIHESIWIPWAKYNFGDTELAPWTRFTTDPPEDMKANSEVIANVATSLKTFQEAGARVDVPAILDQFNIPRPADDEQTETAPAPGATPTPTAALSAAPRRPPASSVRGQSYCDAVADAAQAKFARLVAGDVRELLSAIDGATSYEDARARILKAYDGLPEPKTRELLEAAIVLGGLAGRLAAKESA
ncbi:MAG: phage portal protein family protein [Thermoplasmataceae archaeon]